jgi:hypothetical protein
MPITGAYSSPAFTNTLNVKAAVTAVRYTAIDVEVTTGSAILTTLAGAMIGVAQDNTDGPHGVPYQHTGITPMVTGAGGVAAGDFFQVDAAGGAVRAIASGKPHGRVLTGAIAGKLCTVQLHIQNVAPAT